MAEKTKINLRGRPPQIVKDDRRARNRILGKRRGTATIQLNHAHGIPEPELPESDGGAPRRPFHRLGDPAQLGTPRFYLEGLSEIDFTINGQCWREKRIASRWTIRGVHTGELLGTRPSGRAVNFTGVTISVVKDHQVEDNLVCEVIEEWNYWDLPGLASQIREEEALGT
jgi:hypothetical protein